MIDRKRILMRAGLAAILVAAACTSKPAVPLKIVGVDLSHEIDQHNEPRSARETFAPSSTVYACVAVEGTGTGTLAARWTDPEGKVLAEQTQEINATQPDPKSPQRFEHHLKPEGGWPVSEGRYKVVITLNGKEPKTREFGIR
jgi:hypothetical protein